MGKLVVFENVSLDGYFVDENGDMQWAKEGDDEEFDAFTAENAKGGGVLLFGRATYDLMAGFWPTPLARRLMPVVAERMNALPKVVFSRTLEKAAWSNTTVARGDLLAEVRALKASGADLALMGSGRIVAQLVPARVVDEYQFVVNPVVLGKGRTVFEGVAGRPRLTLARSRVFRNGKVFLSYAPA